MEEFAGSGPDGLELDWDAIAAVLPALREPVLGAGWPPLGGIDAAVKACPASYLGIAEEIRLGLNDLENGDHDARVPFRRSG
ncbi:hypothetical protein ACFO4E_15150 [Nocardiopsis mangrovi]|uniref:Uncharacterized protein n=1 Tax=Nocardiopsis mangrovi TaxID=1179818 RepID=A0ABV9DWC0_9ACTN